jgi:hypothetical protein
MKQPAYHPREPVLLTERMRQQIAREVRALDKTHTATFKQLTPARRTVLALGMMEAAQRAETQRLLRRDPALGAQEARRIVRGMGVTAYERLQREQKTGEVRR